LIDERNFRSFLPVSGCAVVQSEVPLEISPRRLLPPSPEIIPPLVGQGQDYGLVLVFKVYLGGDMSRWRLSRGFAISSAVRQYQLRPVGFHLS